MSAFIPYSSIAEAENRSRQMMERKRGGPKPPENVVEFYYHRRERTGDPELDADLPAGVDVAIEVGERSDDLDMLLESELTEAEADAIVALYSEWASDEAVNVGDYYSYGAVVYRCIQAHTTQADWTPPAVPALWAVAHPGVIPLWVQPTGAHDAYPEGYRVEHAGTIWESTIPANTTEPGTLSQWGYWVEVEI